MPAVAAGAALVWLAAWVYLSVFTASASGYNTSLRLVSAHDHTAPLEFILIMLPTLGLVVLALLSGTSRGRRLGLLWLGFVLLSEFVYVSDIYGGDFVRFNTSLKWWPWVAAGALMTLGPIVLEGARPRWVRWAGVVFCLYPCFYAYDLWQPFRNNPKDAVGKLEGASYLTREEFPRLILGRLKIEKTGVAIERPTPRAVSSARRSFPFRRPEDVARLVRARAALARVPRGHPPPPHPVHAFYDGRIRTPATGSSPRGSTTSSGTGRATRRSSGPRSTRRSARSTWVDILTYQDEDGRRVGFWRRIPAGPR